MYKGINILRNGLDDAHGLDDNDIKNPIKYKSEIILSLNTAAIISQFLIYYFNN